MPVASMARIVSIPRLSEEEELENSSRHKTQFHPSDDCQFHPSAGMERAARNVGTRVELTVITRVELSFVEGRILPMTTTNHAGLAILCSGRLHNNKPKYFFIIPINSYDNIKYMYYYL